MESKASPRNRRKPSPRLSGNVRAGDFVFLSTEKITKHYHIGRSINFNSYDQALGKWEIKSCVHLLTNQRRSVKIYDKQNLQPAERK